MPSNNIIYDFFLFNNEFDMLEIRLYELYDYVTLFLIAESNRTLSGKPKPFYLKNNWTLFSRYHNKIRRVEVPLSGLINEKGNSWDNEREMRDEGIRLALPKSTKDFLLMTSDVDEIPKSRFIRALKSCELPEQFPPTCLQCDFYYYSFEFLQPDVIWQGGTLSRFSPNTNVPSQLREARVYYRPMTSTCFHCSFCFDSVASVRLKLSSFAHTELDIERFHNLTHIVDRFRNGKDFFDRVGLMRRTNTSIIELPRLLQVERERFMYMLNRSSLPNAGFSDI